MTLPFSWQARPGEYEEVDEEAVREAIPCTETLTTKARKNMNVPHQ